MAVPTTLSSPDSSAVVRLLRLEQVAARHRRESGGAGTRAAGARAAAPDGWRARGLAMVRAPVRHGRPPALVRDAAPCRGATVYGGAERVGITLRGDSGTARRYGLGPLLACWRFAVGVPCWLASLGDHMQPRTRGAWIVHHTHKLAQVQDTTAYERIENAGRAAILLAAIAESKGTEVVTERVHALALANHITTREVPFLLGVLERHQLIDQDDDRIRVLGVTTDSVLEHADRIFEELGPEPHEQAAILLAEETSKSPLGRREAEERIADELTVSRPEEILEEAAEIGFVDTETARNEEQVYFNGNIFRRDAVQKTQAVLSSLSTPDRTALAAVEQLLTERGCIPLATLEKALGTDLFAKLGPLGFYDIHSVENERGSTYFVTRPSAFSKFREGPGDAFVDDALDMAKALVACLTFGMTLRAPSQGRISMLPLLLNKLIQGLEVGPATAIGRDYQALEQRGVVRVRPSGMGSRFYLRLLKPDVGRLALNVLTTGDTSHEMLPEFPGAAVTHYVAPEENRQVRRKRSNATNRAHAHKLLHTLRTAGMRSA